MKGLLNKSQSYFGKFQLNRIKLNNEIEKIQTFLPIK